MKKNVFSGIQPSGTIHLGNYLGAIKNWIDLQNTYNCTFCIVDLHAITVKQDKKELFENTLSLAKLYIALGIDPVKSTIFIQSHIPAHPELAWILNTITKISELERMTQFKDKAKKHIENINVGLFTYPVLMASDILLYDTHVVPVGIDQVQHVELTRDIAKKFNTQFEEVFVIPEVKIQKEGAKIYGLDDPSKKMSKSSGEKNYISFLDTEKQIIKKIKSAVTDSDSKIYFDTETKPAISNLLTIYSLISGLSMKELEKRFENSNYGAFKEELIDLLLSFLSPIQKRVDEMSDKEVYNVLSQGAQKASEKAAQKMKQVKDALGFVVQ